MIREAVHVGAVEVEAVAEADVAVGSVRSARTSGTDRAIETHKGVIFIVASVLGQETDVSNTGGSIKINVNEVPQRKIHSLSWKLKG